MTKELEAFKKLIDSLDYEDGFGLFYDEEAYKIIETALKDYENLKTINNALKDKNIELCQERVKHEKKLQALEIIKELILEDLAFDDKEQAINFSFGISTLCIKIKDKDKYYLLKEELE